MTPYEQGADAFLGGRQVTSNPWPSGRNRIQWGNGWNAEFEKAKVALVLKDSSSGDRHLTLVFNRSLTDAEALKIRTLVDEQICNAN